MSLDPEIIKARAKKKLSSYVHQELEQRIKDRYPFDVPMGLSEALSQSELTKIRNEAQQIRAAANLLFDKIDNDEDLDPTNDANWPFAKNSRIPKGRK